MGPTKPWQKNLFLIPLVAAMTVGLFVIDGDFVYDDRLTLIDNPLMDSDVGYLEAFDRDIWGYKLSEEKVPAYRPLTYVMWKAIWQSSPGNPLPFRVFSLLFHVLATFGAWLLCRRLALSKWASIAAASLFAVHAIHAEALGGISWQADIFSAGLGFFALVVAVGSIHIYSLAALFGLLILSAGIKESGVLFCVMIVGLAWMRDELSSRQRWGLAATAGLALIIQLAIQLPLNRSVWSDPTNNLYYASSGLESLLLSFSIVGQGLQLSFLPLGLTPTHGYATTTLDSADLLGTALPGILLLILAIVGGIVALYRKKKAFFLFLCLLCGPILLQSNLLITVQTNLAERLLYMSALGAMGLLVVGLEHLLKNAPIRTLVVGILFALLIAQSWRVERAWKSDETLWAYAVEENPTNYRAQMNYAATLFNNQEIEAGIWHTLLGIHIKNKLPAAMDWTPITSLEKKPIQQRIIDAPGVLNQENPCLLIDALRTRIEPRIPGFTVLTNPLFGKQYPDCRPGT
jgi:hypothetical protein